MPDDPLQTLSTFSNICANPSLFMLNMILSLRHRCVHIIAVFLQLMCTLALQDTPKLRSIGREGSLSRRRCIRKQTDRCSRMTRLVDEPGECRHPSRSRRPMDLFQHELVVHASFRRRHLLSMSSHILMARMSHLRLLMAWIPHRLLVLAWQSRSIMASHGCNLRRKTSKGEAFERKLRMLTRTYPQVPD